MAGDAFTVMGVLNVTPDSFSDGGRWATTEAAIAHGRRLIAEGADVVDVGGESTRPGAEPVPEAEERRRVLDVVAALAGEVVISIDTTKASVARAALGAGATYVNDVSALGADPAMAAVVADAGATVCLMHRRGEPRTMQDDPRYEDVVGEVRDHLAARAAFAIDRGIAPERIRLDPGIGFGKTVDHNLALLDGLDALVALGHEVVVGVSRKGFLGRLTGRAQPAERVAATVAANVLAYARGARTFRVHDVPATRDGLAVAAATLRGHG